MVFYIFIFNFDREDPLSKAVDEVIDEINTSDEEVQPFSVHREVDVLLRA
jgi:hypothetical protein